MPSCDHERMADRSVGQTVWWKRQAHRLPLWAWVPEPMDALDAVHRHMSDYTVKPETVAPLFDAALLGLGLEHGQVCRVQSYSGASALALPAPGSCSALQRQNSGP